MVTYLKGPNDQIRSAREWYYIWIGEDMPRYGFLIF
jgi:hypothetical protein